MSDRRRIVSIDSAGTVTTIKDLEDLTIYSSVAGSWQVKAPPRKPIEAHRQRPYGGSRTVDERHDNGEISWKMLVKGTTADNAILNVESALTVLESSRTDLFFEWRPDGATSSVYYEIRGRAQWNPTYSWALFQGAQAMYVDVAIPVGPLAWGARQTITFTLTTVPAVLPLTGVLGDAPALVDVTLSHGDGTVPGPVFALLGWWKRVTATPVAGVAPIGVIEAENRNAATGWTTYAGGATWSGGSGLRVVPAGAGTTTADFTVDPSVLAVDAFSPDNIDVEVWARVHLDGGLVSPRLTLSMFPTAGAGYGPTLYSAEYGSVGKPIVIPSSGSWARFVRLGTLAMPCRLPALAWTMRVAGSYAAGSSGQLGLDQLILVPARARALSPSGKPLDSSYPKFYGSTAYTSKTIRGADLSGLSGVGDLVLGRSPGLGGTPIEVPPGNVDMLVKLSSLVPDDPTSDTTSEQLAHSIVGSFGITPRYWVGKGA